MTLRPVTKTDPRSDARKWAARNPRPTAACLELWVDGPLYDTLAPLPNQGGGGAKL
jgi:hypothetical protein